MTVFRRIKRIYRCRSCCVRFAVLIATALLCALEAVKYKNRLKITGLPNIEGNVLYHPPTLERNQDRFHEIKKAQISSPEGLNEDHGRDVLKNEDDTLIHLDTQTDSRSDSEGETLNEAEQQHGTIKINKDNSNKILNPIQQNQNELMLNQNSRDYVDTRKKIEESVGIEIQNIGDKKWTKTDDNIAVKKDAKERKVMKRVNDDTGFAVVQGKTTQEKEKNHKEGNGLPARGDFHLKENKEHTGKEMGEEKAVHDILGADMGEDHTENRRKKTKKIKPEKDLTIARENLQQKKQGIDKSLKGRAHGGDKLFEGKGIAGVIQKKEANDGMTVESHLTERLKSITEEHHVNMTKNDHEKTALERGNATLRGPARSSGKNHTNSKDDIVGASIRINWKETEDVIKKLSNMEPDKRKADERETKHEHIYGAKTEVRRNYTRRTYKDTDGNEGKIETKETRSKQGRITIHDGENHVGRMEIVVRNAFNKTTASIKGKGNDKEDNITLNKVKNIANGTKWEKLQRNLMVTIPSPTQTQSSVDTDSIGGSQGRREQAVNQKVSEEVLRQRQKERKQMVDSFCQRSPRDKNLPPKREMNFLIVLDEPGIIYCSVPKVASTEWREALSFYHDHGRVQGKQAQNRTIWKHLSEYSNRNVTTKIQRYYKFLFVREPFERLLSAYKSKFLAKNEVYHKKFGREIIKKFRKNATEHQKMSGYGVTFFEFVKYVAFAKAYDEHWRPFSQLCHVCSIGYNFIGYLETIEEDAAFLIKDSNLNGSMVFKSNRHSRTSSDLLRFYSQIPLRYINRLRSIYSNDFEIFGYQFPGPLKSLVNSQLSKNN